MDLLPNSSIPSHLEEQENQRHEAIIYSLIEKTGPKIALQRPPHWPEKYSEQEKDLRSLIRDALVLKRYRADSEYREVLTAIGELMVNG